MFIVFEGLDGAGKSTQAVLLKRYLEYMTKKVVHNFRLPGSTNLGEKIRNLIFTESQIAPVASIPETLLFCAGHAQLIEEKIMPALARDEIVILDRYKWSTIAYQCYGRGLNASAVETVLDFATGFKNPDMTIFIEVSPEVSYQRSHSNSLANRNPFDNFDIPRRQRIYDGYRYCINHTPPEKVMVVNGDQEQNSVHIQICNRIFALLNIPAV